MKNKVKQILTVLIILFANVSLWACPACKKQQPKITQGLTHGAGPGSNWDWVIIGVITLITILTLVYLLKYLIKPGEKSENHIKQSILNN